MCVCIQPDGAMLEHSAGATAAAAAAAAARRRAATRAQLSLARAPLGTASASGEPDGASWAGHASGWAPPQTLAS